MPSPSAIFVHCSPSRSRPCVSGYLLLVPLLLLLSVAAWAQERERSQEGALVFRARFSDEAITPATARFLERALMEADAAGASLLVLELDTPGGLVQSTHRIVKAIIASRIPVVVYVAPSGARAASAGVFITLAAHVAAMAPGTHIGAAHPVQIGGGVTAPSDTAGARPMDEKIVNDARAWARSLAELRGRNADWAERAVSASVSITSTQALGENVVDLIAADVRSLLDEIDGREVQIDGRTVQLRTGGATIHAIEPWWGERVLGAISDPNVAFLLLVLGFYALIFEFYSGGWGVPGTVGAVCLLLGFFGLAVLPINIVGLLLIFLALGLFVAEAFVPSFGALTAGGVAALILGGLMLVDSPSGVVEVSTWVVVPVALAIGLITLFLMGQVVRTHRSRIQTGSETMIGETAVADETFQPEAESNRFTGLLRFHGELWRGVCDQAIQEGERVLVKERQGLTLVVEMTPPTVSTES